MCRLRLPLLARAKHIDRQYLLRFSPTRQNLSRAIHAAAVVAGSSSTRILRASGANPYNKGRLRPLGWMRLQVTVWPAGARSSWCQLKFRLTAQSTKAGPSLRASEEVKHDGTLRARCTSGSTTHSGSNLALRLLATAKRHTSHNSPLRCYLRSTNTRWGAGCAGSGLNAKCPITHQRRIGDPANSTPCASPHPNGPCRPIPGKLARHGPRTSLARH